MNKIQKFARKMGVSTLAVVGAMAVSATNVFAVATGNEDLDVLIGEMTTGLETIKKGGLYIVGAVLIVAVAFLGGRWLWNMFRSWLSRAQ